MADSSLQKIKKDIDDLQKIEKDLLSTLDTNPNLTVEQKKELYTKVNGVTNMRIRLYQTLNDASGMYKDILAGSQEKLELQTDAIGIMERELDNTKKRIDALSSDKNNKMRLVEVNEYYGSKYSEQAGLMKIIVLTLIPVIIVTFLKKKYLAAYMPDIMYYILIIGIFITGGVFFVLKLGNYMTRDSMNYQEFDWGFNKGNAPKPSNMTEVDPWLMPEMKLGACIDKDCCADGTEYDEDKNKCVVKSEESITVKQKLHKLCPVDLDAAGMISKGNIATYQDYLLGACTTAGTCDSTTPDPISKKLLNKTENCGAWHLDSVGLWWDQPNKKWSETVLRY